MSSLTKSRKEKDTRGRPTDGDVARSEMIGFRATEAERKILEQQADAEGRPLSNWIRRMLGLKN